MRQAGSLRDRPEGMAGGVGSPDRVPEIRLGLVAASPVPRHVGQGSLTHEASLGMTSRSIASTRIGSPVRREPTTGTSG